MAGSGTSYEGPETPWWKLVIFILIIVITFSVICKLAFVLAG